MNSVTCIDMANGKIFTKEFDDLIKQKQFMRKCRYSKKLFITGYTYDGQDEYEFLIN